MSSKMLDQKTINILLKLRDSGQVVAAGDDLLKVVSMIKKESAPEKGKD